MSRVRCLLFGSVVCCAMAGAGAQVPDLPLMPMPYRITETESAVHAIHGPLNVAYVGPVGSRVAAAVARFWERWERRTGEEAGARIGSAERAQLVIACGAADDAGPTLADDESYELKITAEQIRLNAPQETGVLRGLSTLFELVQVDGTWIRLPCVTITDRPRCAWRGLALDLVHHWIPVSEIERTLDGMEIVKLNVLQLHLGDDHGLRLELPTHPEFAGRFPATEMLTPRQVKEIVAYAQARGIRVVPELSLAQIAGSWNGVAGDAANANAAAAGSTRGEGLDPAEARTYATLDGIVGDVATLFPDAYVSIGAPGSVVARWAATPRFGAELHVDVAPGGAGVYGYFVDRVNTLLQKHGRILAQTRSIASYAVDAPADQHAPYPPGSARVDAIELDAGRTAAELYAVALPAADAGVRAPSRVSMGSEPVGTSKAEASLATEWVSPASLDARLWPRLAAVAEHLWTEPSARWAQSLERRLAATELRLHEAGIDRKARVRFEAADLQPGSAESEALRIVADAVEPLSDADRGRLQGRVSLTQLADWAPTESVTSRRVAERIRVWLASGHTDLAPEREAIVNQLRLWSAAGRIAAGIPADANPVARARVEVARTLQRLSDIGLAACGALNHAPLSAMSAASADAEIARAATPTAAAVRFAFLPELRLLVAAASAAPTGRPVSPGAGATAARAR